MAFGHVSDDLARGHIESGIEIGRAVADVVMGAPLWEPGSKWQDRGGAVERLDLGLLVDTENEGSVGRVDVEPHDVADLLDEQRVRASA